MRNRQDIEFDADNKTGFSSSTERLILEVLLDIRDLAQIKLDKERSIGEIWDTVKEKEKT